MLRQTSRLRGLAKPVLVFAACWLVGHPRGATAQGIAANEAVVRRCADDLWNKHKRRSIPGCYTADHISHTNGVTSPRKGLSGESDAMAELLNTWPDIKHTSDAVLVSGDYVTARWRMSAHNARTEKRVDSNGITIFRLVHGKFAADWTPFATMPLIMAREKVPDGAQ